MIEEVKYKVLTAREAVWYALRERSDTLGTIANLRKGDTLTVAFPITITIDQETAKQVLKEYMNENCNY